MSGKNYSNISIRFTTLVIILISILCVQIQSASGRGTRNGRPELQQIESLNAESLEQSIENLYLLDFYIAPRTGAGGITLPLPKTIGQEDIESIIRNQRFVKVCSELSQTGSIKASELVIEQINETLPLYKRMFSQSWDKVYKVHENEPLSERQTIGPSLQYEDPNGAPTLAGLRIKLLSLVLLAGNLKLESTRPAIESIVSEALAQRNKFYDPNTGFSGDRFSMLRKAGIYNRQILATGILLTSGKQTQPNTNSTSSELDVWQTLKPDNFGNAVNIRFHKPLDDNEFDKICKDEIAKGVLERTSVSNETQQVSAEFEVVETNSNIKIVPVPNQDVLLISADQIEEILNRIGFTNSQIEKYGIEIRDALAKSGAVRILIDDEVQAALAVRGDDVFISSRTKGQHIYNITTGWTNPQR